jgi:hypothetical protein
MAQYLVRATPNKTSIKSGGKVSVTVDYHIDPPAPTPTPQLHYSASPAFKVTATPATTSLIKTGDVSVKIDFVVTWAKNQQVHTCTLLFNGLDDECSCSFEVTQ